MTDKISLTNLVNLQNETTAVNAINANNAVLTTAMDNTLSRDGTQPNQMGSNLDMNSNRIINLPTAISLSEPVTLNQMTAAMVANGNINTGLTGVPVSAAMQPVVAASTIAAAETLFGISPVMQPIVNSSTLAAAQIALGIVSSGGGGVTSGSLDTRARGLTSTIPSTLNILQTGGYTTIGDGGAGIYKRDISLTNGGFQSADGAFWTIMANPALPEQFGAKGDGTTNDATALQAAVTYGQTNSTPVFLTKTYLIGTAISITASVTIIGAGRNVSQVILNTTTMDGFDIACANACHFSNFEIVGKSNATGGSLISLAGPVSGINQFTNFRDMWFQGGNIQLNANAAAEWAVDTCFFNSPTGVGVSISNTVLPDAGDMCISNCAFANNAGVGIAILQTSAGGLRLTNNKIIQWANGYVLSLASGIATSDLFMGQNSFEAFTASAVTLQKSTGILFGTVALVGNEFNGGPVGIDIVDNTGTWMSNVTIVGNNISPLTSGVAVVINGTSGFIFSGNNVTAQGGATTGLSIGSSSSNGNVYGNNFIGCGISNNSGNNIRLSNN